MKILQVNTVVSYGSTGRISRDISDILDMYGHESTIAYGRGSDAPEYKTIKIGNSIDNYIHFAKSYIFNRHGFGSLKATKKVIEQIEEYNPDIIQLHNIHGYYLHISELFKYLKKINKPVVWLLHDQWPISGGAAYFDLTEYGEIPLKEKKELKQEYPKSITRTNYQKNYKEKEQIFSGLSNCTIITPSNWLGGVIRTTFLKQYPIYTIYNGIDTNLFRYKNSNLIEKYNIQNKKIVLAVSSDWDTRKGVDFIRELPNRLTDDIQIIMIGVNDNLKVTLPKSIITISKTNSVDELIKWYSIADVFINPTLFDNFPTVNLEALACGTPIITYNTGGSSESLSKETGTVIPYNDKEAFIEAIIKCPKKNSEIEKKCRERSRMFDFRNQYYEYVKLYESLEKTIF